ncbi:MAG: endonuclease domain-containing protein [Thermodesulfovibrionales bacterium]|nr:endonuclease domain-containing protein [Thermodesulfovibrionales bacterium]
MSGCVLNKIYYNPKLKELSRQLRNNSTKAEIRLWTYLKSKQLMSYDFHRQKPIDNYIVDFFCSKLMLAIELDGYTHSFEEIYEKDKLKEERLHALGITVLRFADDDVMNDMETILRSLYDYIEAFEMGNNSHTPLSPLHRGDKK